jgi:hypothetical protein
VPCGIGAHLCHQLSPNILRAPVAAVLVQHLNQYGRQFSLTKSIPWGDISGVDGAEVDVVADYPKQVVSQAWEVDVDGRKVDFGEAVSKDDELTMEAINLTNLLRTEIV